MTSMRFPTHGELPGCGVGWENCGVWKGVGCDEAGCQGVGGELAASWEWVVDGLGEERTAVGKELGIDVGAGAIGVGSGSPTPGAGEPAGEGLIVCCGGEAGGEEVASPHDVKIAASMIAANNRTGFAV